MVPMVHSQSEAAAAVDSLLVVMVSSGWLDLVCSTGLPCGLLAPTLPSLPTIPNQNEVQWCRLAHRNLTALRLGGAVGSAESDVANGAVVRPKRRALFWPADSAG